MMRVLRLFHEHWGGRTCPAHCRRPGTTGKAWAARGERGQAAVEFLVALPLMMTILFGILELGIAVFNYNTIANAAQEGARYAALNPMTVAGTCANPDAGIGERICRLTAGLNGGQITYAATVQGNLLRVAVTYRYQAVSGPVARTIGHNGVVDMSAAATTLVE